MPNEIKLTPKEVEELRTRRQMLNEATLRLGQIDLAMADLESQRHQARIEAARQSQEFRAAAERAGTAHGITNGTGWQIDIEEGVLRQASSGTAVQIGDARKQKGRPKSK